MTIVFVAGAGGSFLGALTFATGGWMLTAATGGALGLAALVLFSTEFMGDPAPAPHHAATPAPSTQGQSVAKPSENRRRFRAGDSHAQRSRDV